MPIRRSVRMARSAISPRLAISTVENIAFSSVSRIFYRESETFEIRTPSTECGDVPGISKRVRFADKSFHDAPIHQGYAADAERRRNLRGERSETAYRYIPQLNRD